MERLEQINQRTIYTKWRNRTKVKIYPLIAKFFSNPITDNNQARMVARIIDGLNNPYYEYNRQLEPLADTDVIAVRILVQLDVEEFYKIMKKKFGSLK